MDGSRPSSLFESRLNGLDQDALKRVARSIGITLSQTEDLLPIEVQVRKELEKFGTGETVDDKALLFWRTARIVQTRSLVPHAHTEGDTLFTAAVWNLLTQVNIRTTTGRTTPAQLAREAEEALRHRQRLQRQRITGGEPRQHHNSRYSKADAAGDVAEGVSEGITEGLLSGGRSSGSSSSYTPSSSRGSSSFDDCCPDSLFSLVRATIKYRRFIR